ncbi:TetR family transcriptional regulator C-terminal domain-containing protein [Streptomyces sp. NPDC048479]|uniref:TetR/AcrR family transcriptional regulator n=1 Tax=Streptomyces sp. NPDC048479 TaxID=3154725 RepID=UPI00341BCCE7
MARKRVELRREEILEATIEQIQQRGIAAVRVADVATALGVSNGLVFYHFESKEALTQEAFAYAARRDLDVLRATCSRSVPAAVRFKSVVRQYGPTGKALGWRLWIDGWSTGLREPGLRAVMRSMDEDWRGAITGLIEEGVETGEFSCDDPVEAAWRITAFLDGLAVQLVARGGQLKKTRTTQWVNSFVARELGIDAALLEPGRPDPR